MGLALLTSCDLDNYDEPSETFTGQFVDKNTQEPIQTEIGDHGIQLYMYETSYKDNPTPWTFTAMQDGKFNNTKVFAATYKVQPYGPFVPIDPVEGLKISGTTTQNFEVEPFLKINVVGQPTVTDNKISVTVHIERGTSNPAYQQDITDVVLYVNNSSTYVGDNNYDARVTTRLTGDDAKNALNNTVTLTSDDVDKANGGHQNYYIRVGARIDYQTNGFARYNYTAPMTVAVP